MSLLGLSFLRVARGTRREYTYDELDVSDKKW